MAFYNSPSDLLPKQAFRWRVRFGNKDETEACKVKPPSYFVKSITKPAYEIKSTEHKYLGMHKFNFPTHVEWKPITITFYDVYDESALKGFKINNTDLNSKFDGGSKFLNIDDKPLINNRSTSDTIHKTPLSSQGFFATLLNKAGYYQPEEFDREDDLLRFRRHIYKKNMISAFVGKAEDYEIQGGEERFVNTDSWNALYIDELHPDGFVLETWKIVNPLITSVKFGELSYEDDKILNVTVDVIYDWAKLQTPKEQEVAKFYSEFKYFNKNQEITANYSVFRQDIAEKVSSDVPYQKVERFKNDTVLAIKNKDNQLILQNQDNNNNEIVKIIDNLNTESRNIKNNKAYVSFKKDNNGFLTSDIIKNETSTLDENKVNEVKRKLNNEIEEIINKLTNK